MRRKILHRRCASNPPSANGTGFGRGVWMAPWLGENGETILAAVNRDERQVGKLIVVPIGGNQLVASEELWTRLDADDPEVRGTFTVVRGGAR